MIFIHLFVRVIKLQMFWSILLNSILFDFSKYIVNSYNKFVVLNLVNVVDVCLKLQAKYSFLSNFLWFGLVDIHINSTYRLLNCTQRSISRVVLLNKQPWDQALQLPQVLRWSIYVCLHAVFVLSLVPQ